jgi:uncharacterized protein YjbK
MKAQTEIISFSLNILILFVLVTYAYIWGTDIFRENVDRAKLSSIEKFIKELDSRIQWVAKFGGKDRMVLNLPATIEFKENKTNEIYNLIEIRTKFTSEFPENWFYINTENFEKIGKIKDSESLIRERKIGKTLVAQLFYRVRMGERGYFIHIVPSANRICSENCEITIENLGTEDISVNGKKVTAIKVKVTIGRETGIAIESAFNDTSCVPANCVNATIMNVGVEPIDLTALVAYIDNVPQAIDSGNVGILAIGRKTTVGIINDTYVCGKVLKLRLFSQEAFATITCE